MRSVAAPRWWWLVPPLVAIAGMLVAGYHVGRPAIWRDEAASIGAALRTWAALGGLIAHVDVVHAAYYALLHLWFDVVGYTPFTLRLPSVLAAGATAGVVAILGRRLAGPLAGAAAGFACAVLPSMVWAGGEGRSYAMTALTASLTTLALVHAMGPHATRVRTVVCWAAYAALLAGATVLFLDTLLLGGAHLVTALLVGGRRNRLAAPAAVAGATLAVSPLIRMSLAQTGQVGWIAHYDAGMTVQSAVVDQWFRDDMVGIAWGVVLLAGAIVAVARRRIEPRLLAVALPWAVLPGLALVAVGLVHAPVYWPRYVTFTAPAVALLAGAAAAALPRLLTVVAVAALAAVAVPQIQADRQPRAKADSEMQLAAQLVGRERRATDGASGIVYGQYDAITGVTTRIEAIAYPEDFRGLTDLTATGPLTTSTALFGSDIPTVDAVPRMARLRTVWFLLDMDSWPKTRIPVAGMTALGFRETGVFRTSGSMLLRFTR